MDMEAAIRAPLKRLYFIMLMPALAGIVAVRLNNTFQWVAIQPITLPTTARIAIFLLAVFCVVSIPILARTFFAHKMRGQVSVSPAAFLRFQRLIVITAMLSPYLALLAELCASNRFLFTSIVILALYAAYYYYPSSRRIAFDERMFRVG